MLIRRVVDGPIQDDPNAAAMGLLHETVEVFQRAEPRMNAAKVADVIATIGPGGREDGGQPDDLGP